MDMGTTFRLRLTTVTLILTLWLSAVQTVHANNPLLALIATGDERAETIAALIEASLSRDRDLALLDRRQVRDMLAEQEWLSQASLTTDGALQAGVLLGCDVFAELRVHALSQSKQGFSAVASLIAFDAVTGSRLVDRTFSGVESPDRLAEMATVALSEAVRAWREIGDGIGRTISIGTVRNVNLPSRHSHLPTAMHALLERSLVNVGDGIAILERQRLDHINREASLSEDRRNRLWASMVLIDIDMLQGTTLDEVRIRAVLKASDGNDMATIDQTGPATSIHDRVQHLTVGILAAIDIDNTAEFISSSVQRRLESTRYLADGEWLYDRGQWADALRMAETALALWPDSLEAQSFLVKTLENIKLPDKSTASFLAALDRHERILDVYEQWQRAGRLLRFSVSWSGHGPRTVASGLMEQIESLENLPDDLARRYNAYLRRARTVFMDPVPESPVARRNILNMIPIWARDSDAWLDDLLLVCGEDWLFRERLYGYVASQKRMSGDPGLASLRDPLNVETLSADGKRRLLDYYIVHADAGNMEACLAAVDFAHRFPDGLPHARQTMEHYLDRAIDLAILSGTPALLRIVSFIEESLLLQPGMFDVYAAALRRINQEAESRQTVIPDAYILLDKCDTNVVRAGIHLIQAVKLVADSGRVVQSLPLPGRRINLPRESRLRELRQIYGDRYGSAMPNEPAGMADTGGSATEWGRMEILCQGYDAAPGLAAILRNNPVMQKRYSAGVLRPIIAMEKHDSAIWILFRLGPSYELVRLHPDTGEKVSLGVVKNGQLPTGKISFGMQTVYVPMGSYIACFATNRTTPWVLGLEDGLPDVIVDAVIEVDNDLYIGASRVQSGREGGWNIGDGMLLFYSMEQQTWQLLASSARTEGVSALDNTPPYRVSGFHHDVLRGRLLLGLNSMRHGQATTLSGIWAMDLASHSLQRISPRLRQPNAPRLLSDGRWLVAADRYRLSFWMPETDHFNHTSLASIYDSVERDKTMYPLIPYRDAHNIAAILHNRVYLGWTCVIRDNKSSGATVLPTVPDSVLQAGTRFSSHLAPISVRTYDDTVLFATHDAVWRMVPSSRATHASETVVP